MSIQSIKNCFFFQSLCGGLRTTKIIYSIVELFTNQLELDILPPECHRERMSSRWHRPLAWLNNFAILSISQRSDLGFIMVIKEKILFLFGEVTSKHYFIIQLNSLKKFQKLWYVITKQIILIHHKSQSVPNWGYTKLSKNWTRYRTLSRGFCDKPLAILIGPTVLRWRDFQCT